MGPVLEERTFAHQEAFEQLGAIGLVAREEDHMVGACHGLNRVELNVAQRLDQCLQPRGIDLAPRWRAETLQREPQAPCVTVCDEGHRLFGWHASVTHFQAIGRSRRLSRWRDRIVGGVSASRNGRAKGPWQEVAGEKEAGEPLRL